METNNTVAQHPALIVERTPLAIAEGSDDLWIECRTCGRANYTSKGPISHKRGCSDSGAQYSATPVAAPVATTTETLKAFGRNVRTYSQTKGRDEDTLAAVRGGFLSESDAMNTDD